MGFVRVNRGFEVAVKDREELEGGKEKLVYWDGKIPERATRNSAGYDFFAAEDIKIPSMWGPLLNRIFVKINDNKDDKEKVSLYLRKNYRGDTSEEKDESKEFVKKRFAPILVHTGIKAYMAEDEVLMLYNRSSNPKKLGLVLANSVGVIDSDYYGNSDNDGEIMFAFYNLFPFPVTIKKGDKLGQGVFTKFLKADNDISGGDRLGGFGSTDKKEELKTEMKEGAKTFLGKAQGFVDKLGEGIDKAVNNLSKELDESVNGMLESGCSCEGSDEGAREKNE